jgi:hypothetical protein
MSKKQGKCPICFQEYSLSKKQLLDKIGLKDRVDATEGEIKKAFKEMSKILHPDRGGDKYDFEELIKVKDELLESPSLVETASQPQAPVAPIVPKPMIMNHLQYQAAMCLVQNLKKTFAENPNLPCPHCKRKRR